MEWIWILRDVCSRNIHYWACPIFYETPLCVRLCYPSQQTALSSMLSVQLHGTLRLVFFFPPAVIILKSWIILPLNLGFISEVEWDNGACLWAEELHQVAGLAHVGLDPRGWWAVHIASRRPGHWLCMHSPPGVVLGNCRTLWGHSGLEHELRLVRAITADVAVLVTAEALGGKSLRSWAIGPWLAWSLDYWRTTKCQVPCLIGTPVMPHKRWKEMLIFFL